MSTRTGALGSAQATVTVEAIPVLIDVRPQREGNPDNVVDPRLPVPVAVWGGTEIPDAPVVDVTTIVDETVLFAGAPVLTSGI